MFGCLMMVGGTKHSLFRTPWTMHRYAYPGATAPWLSVCASPDLNSSMNDLTAASLDQLFHSLSVALVHEVPVIFCARRGRNRVGPVCVEVERRPTLLPAVFSIAGLVGMAFKTGKNIKRV